MNKKLLIGIIVVIVVFVIAAVILGKPVFAFNWITFFIPLAVWIYLVWMVRKKKISLFRDQMEPELAERRLKRLKAFLLVAGISLGAFIISVVLHNAIYGLFIHFFGADFWDRVGLGDEPVFFFLAMISALAFCIGTIGGLVIFLKGRRKTT